MRNNLLKSTCRDFTPLAMVVILIFALHFSANAQPRSEIQVTSGVPTLIIDGKTYPPYAYMSYLGEKKYYKEVASCGVHLYNIPAYLGERGINTTSGIGPFRLPIWTGEDQYDFSSLINDFDEIIESDPSAKIVVRLYLDPPLWWEKLNPDACCLLPNGDTFRQCFASEKWRKATGSALKDCLDWLLKSEYSKYLIGVHVAGGSTEEWFYHRQQFNDISPVRKEAFQTWLKNKYKSEMALQDAWQDSSVTFKTAEPADISEPDKTIRWRDPSKEQNYIDTYQFHSEVMVDNIAYFCKIVKDVSNGNLLTGAFYGYHYYVTNPAMGHGALSRLLSCKDLDYLSSPNVYNRVIGEDWPPMVALQSVQLHGKLWLAENDTRTSITTLLKDRSNGIAPPGPYYDRGVWLGPEEMETSVSFLWKNAGRMLAYGYGGWWFDMWGGWFSHPDLLYVIEKTQQYHAEFLPVNTELMQPEVCVFVDEELSFWDASHGRLTENILSNRYSLGKTGTSHDLFLRTDINSVSTKQYKVIWLMGLLHLTEEEKSNIEEWRQQGKTVLWTDSAGTKIFNKNQKERFIEGKFNWTGLELQKIWEKAGVHLYIDTDDVFYIGHNWLCIHSVTGGARNIKFPFYTQVTDPLTQEILADSTKYLDIHLPSKSTILLRINPELKK